MCPGIAVGRGRTLELEWPVMPLQLSTLIKLLQLLPALHARNPSRTFRLASMPGFPVAAAIEQVPFRALRCGVRQKTLRISYQLRRL